MQEQLINYTKEAFKSAFGSDSERIFLAPGRINIIGEHVDYSDGFVLPAAIDKHICFAVKKTENAEITFFAKDFNDSFSFNVREKQSPVSQTWVNYLLGVFNVIQESGKEVGGLQIAFSSTIPMGSGLSSSAALECGFAYILNEIFNLNLTKKELAVIGQKSEHTFVGVKCGIMDQFSSVFGKEHKVIMLDCNSLEHQYFEANIDGYSLVLFDSCVKHTHLTSGYNDRRRDVDNGKKILWEKFPDVQKFRDFTFEMLDEVREEMGEISFKRCLYLLKEIKRVEKAAKALSEGDTEYLGQLLNETHSGLSTEFEVSCDELDFMVENTLKENGVLGTRIMGGGFGGCSINLIKDENVEQVIESIGAKYKQAFDIGMKVYRVKISDGINEYKKMKLPFDQKNHPHRRYNPLLNEWILVSPQRANRPWQGQTEKTARKQLPVHDPDCYLCSGNVRVNGEKNPNYKGVYIFNNDFGALMKDDVDYSEESSDFFSLQPERGINRVICFSENHGLTLPEMEVNDIKKVVDVWQKQYEELGSLDYINHVQIFENKGQVMGCSNPHPHGQIWAQSSVPSNVSKTQENLKKYFEKNGTSLLEDYAKKELEINERVILENDDFVVIVPFWAVWPYETMVVSKRKIENLIEFSEEEKLSLASIIKDLTTKYDNLFEISFPYSAGIHQSPTDGKSHPEWHFHMHFYPPLLRNAEVKKFMVGYEMLAEAQRDITPEQSAEILKGLSVEHYKTKQENTMQ